MRKILVSACLMGINTRYDGRSRSIDHPILAQWRREDRLIPFCPEVEGGLSIPRQSAEIRMSTTGVRRVVGQDGSDLTEPFSAGADSLLELVLREAITTAIFKDKSPSCGVHRIFDGTFSGQLVKGSGIATERLSKHGVRIFSETEIVEAYRHWKDQIN